MTVQSAQTSLNELRIFRDRTSLLNDENDPEVNFYYNTNINSDYFDLEETAKCLNDTRNSNFSILSLNIRSLHKNLDNFKSILSKLKHDFKLFV